MHRRAVIERFVGVAVTGALAGCTTSATDSTQDRVAGGGRGADGDDATVITDPDLSSEYGLSTCRSFESELGVKIVAYDPESGEGKMQNVYGEALQVSILLESGRFAEGPNGEWPSVHVPTDDPVRFEGGGPIRDVSAVTMEYYRNNSVDWNAIHDRTESVACVADGA